MLIGADELLQAVREMEPDPFGDDDGDGDTCHHGVYFDECCEACEDEMNAGDDDEWDDGDDNDDDDDDDDDDEEMNPWAS